MIECFDVIKEFGKPPQRILHGLTFKIDEGEFVSISGRSGSGKSTLLYLISTLDIPSAGRILIEGKDITTCGVNELHSFRNHFVGFIFQFHYLLPELTALENILLPARNLGLQAQYQKVAENLMDELGVLKQLHKFPSQLSGGEQQRVAIARALLLEPKYIFADEPTGNLDTANARLVMSILQRVNKEKKSTICLVTHDPGYSSLANREILLVDGRIKT